MSRVTFDTGLAVENLQQNGFDLAQSRGIVEVIKTAQADLVTKDDLDHAVELLRKDIDQLRRDLTIRMVLIMGAATAVQIGALFAMLKTLIPGA